jgi:hypothetical protein
MRGLALTVLFALGACATTLPQVVVTGGETFDVRYDSHVQLPAEADRIADGHCGAQRIASFESERVGFEDLSYRTYRCRER